MKQVFITGNYEQDDLERKLVCHQKTGRKRDKQFGHNPKKLFLSSQPLYRVMIYKGMFTPAQLGEYFPDLKNEKL
jgi:glutamate synthase (NADPH) large chain